MYQPPANKHQSPFTDFLTPVPPFGILKILLSKPLSLRLTALKSNENQKGCLHQVQTKGKSFLHFDVASS